MDDVKKYLALLQKYHFWWLCGIIMIVFLATWYVSTGNVRKTTLQNQTAIKSDYQTATQVRSVVNHPNDVSAQGMKALISNQSKDVGAAWSERYEQQRNILVWPEELGGDFLARVEPLRPVERVSYPLERELLDHVLRSRYMNYIQEELPKLAKIIDAEWHPAKKAAGTAPSMGAGSGSSSGPGGSGSGVSGPGAMGPGQMTSGGGGPGGPPAGMSSGGGSLPGADPSAAKTDAETAVVEWEAANQNALQNARFDWSSRPPDRLPTSLDILYAQEDLWVLRGLMIIIKGTNGNADARYNAAIKEIKSIDLGGIARGVREVGKVVGVAAAQRGPAAGGENEFGANMTSGAGGRPGAGAGAGAPMSNSPGAGGSQGGRSNARSSDPADGRYVDDKYEPLTGSRLRSAVASESAAEGDAFIVVAKRMPVRLRLKMDLLKLPAFLAECGNAPLPLEVRQVRINAPSGAASSPGGGMGGGVGGAAGEDPSVAGMGSGGGASMSLNPGSMSGMSGGSSGPGGGMSGFSGPGAAADTTASAYDGEVEIYGIVYIYNPVDTKKLGLPDASSVPAAAPATEPAGGQPAAPQAGG